MTVLSHARAFATLSRWAGEMADLAAEGGDPAASALWRQIHDEVDTFLDGQAAPSRLPLFHGPEERNG